MKTNDTTPAVALDRVSFGYGSRMVLNQVDMVLPQGGAACLIGPNGGGKTTLLRLVLGLLRPDSGEVRVFGGSPQSAWARAGYVPQDFAYDARFPIRVRDVVAMGCLGQPVPGGRAAVARRVSEALESVLLPGLGAEWFSKLSGGQRQRVLIARALAAAPDLLILDEPTSNLDAAAEQEVLDVLERLRGRVTLMVVSHAASVASRFLRDVYCVNRVVHRHPPAERLDDELMRHLVGLELASGESTGPACGQGCEHGTP